MSHLTQLLSLELDERHQEVYVLLRVLRYSLILVIFWYILCLSLFYCFFLNLTLQQRYFTVFFIQGTLVLLECGFQLLVLHAHLLAVLR